jgi:hypothetical protein
MRLAVKHLAALYRKWRQQFRSGEVFRLNYKGPTAIKAPAEFILEVARRAQAPGVYSLQSVLRNIQRDLRGGKRVPGFRGDYAKNSLPFARSVYRVFAGIDLSRRRALMENIASANRQLAAIDSEIERRAKAALEKVKGGVK